MLRTMQHYFITNRIKKTKTGLKFQTRPTSILFSQNLLQNGGLCISHNSSTELEANQRSTSVNVIIHLHSARTETKGLLTLFSLCQGQIHNSCLRLFYFHDGWNVRAYQRCFPEGLICCLINWGLASPEL